MFTILMIGGAAIAIFAVVKINSISYSLKAVMRDRDANRLRFESKIAQLEAELISLHEADSTLAKAVASDSQTAPVEKASKPKRKYYKPRTPKS